MNHNTMPSISWSIKMSSREQKQLTMRINDKLLTLDMVSDAQRYLANILYEIDKTTSDNQKNTVNWIVTAAKSGSYSVTIEGLPKTKEITDSAIVAKLRDFKNGLIMLREEAKRPPYFSDKVLKNIKSLIALTKKGLPIDLFNEGFGEIKLSNEIALNIEKIIGAIYESYGSVEGILNVLDLRDKPIFKITDSLNYETIECHFSRDDLEIAKKALEKRVYVYGLIFSRQDGIRIKINVDEIEIFPSENQLPSIEDIIGIWA